MVKLLATKLVASNFATLSYIANFTLPTPKQDLKFSVVVKNFIELFHSPVKFIKATSSHGNFTT